MRKKETIRQLETALAACKRAWSRPRKFHKRKSRGDTIRRSREGDTEARERRWDQRCGRYAQRAVSIEMQLEQLGVRKEFAMPPVRKAKPTPPVKVSESKIEKESRLYRIWQSICCVFGLRKEKK